MTQEPDETFLSDIPIQIFRSSEPNTYYVILGHARVVVHEALACLLPSSSPSRPAISFLCQVGSITFVKNLYQNGRINILQAYS
jgi:hypothetical protein